ncbi:MAG: aspartate aminotransferase family protein [Oscillospiraceae bacterium]|nr:aspartate aminotransferase family protein [Oscillospiraceae bacterium]
MNTKPFEAYESEVRSYCRRFPAVFTKAKGSKYWDEDGNEYIDFFNGAGALNYGHNNEEIKGQLIDYLESDGVLHALDMYTVPKREFIETFESKILKPRGLDYKIMFTGPTGTNAVEAALKLARKVKKRPGVFALMGAFHGMTLGALALTTDADSRGGAGVPLDNVTHVPAPGMFEGLDTIAYMQTLIDDDHSGVERPSALVIETIQAEGGVNVMPVQWLRDVRAFCDRNDILLIVDDIQVGVGRSGYFFSFERAGIVPDIVTLSKSIGGYGMPMALTLFRPELDIWTPGEHNGTFRGNQLSIVAARAGIDYFVAHRIDEEARRKGEIIRGFLEKEVLPLDSRLQVRGIGMIWGVDFSGVGDKMCGKVLSSCFKKKVVIESAGRKNAVLKIMAALTIEDDVLLDGLGRLRDAIRENL